MRCAIHLDYVLPNSSVVPLGATTEDGEQDIKKFIFDIIKIMI